tara:strand:- start:211 stop:456 length:246 start_codon:yes stop_codon:yes gene_type:complete
MKGAKKKVFRVISGEELITVINPYRQGLWSVWKFTNEEASALAEELLFHTRKETEETMNPFEDQQGHACRSIEGDETGDAA